MGIRVSDIQSHSVPLEKFIVMACRFYTTEKGVHTDCLREWFVLCVCVYVICVSKDEAFYEMGFHHLVKNTFFPLNAITGAQ